MRANDIDSTAKTGYTLTCLMETLYFCVSRCLGSSFVLCERGGGFAEAALAFFARFSPAVGLGWRGDTGGLLGCLILR
jgi:hypothetical protein